MDLCLLLGDLLFDLQDFQLLFKQFLLVGQGLQLYLGGRCCARADCIETLLVTQEINLGRNKGLLCRYREQRCCGTRLRAGKRDIAAGLLESQQRGLLVDGRLVRGENIVSFVFL